MYVSSSHVTHVSCSILQGKAKHDVSLLHNSPAPTKLHTKCPRCTNEQLRQNVRQLWNIITSKHHTVTCISTINAKIAYYKKETPITSRPKKNFYNRSSVDNTIRWHNPDWRKPEKTGCMDNEVEHMLDIKHLWEGTHPTWSYTKNKRAVKQKKTMVNCKQ